MKSLEICKCGIAAVDCEYHKPMPMITITTVLTPEEMDRIFKCDLARYKKLAGQS
jgi:hypothetical protein